MTQEVFNESAAWTCPPGIFFADVECGGSGAGGLADVPGGGQGGGGGAYSKKFAVPVTPGLNYGITAPAGGAAGADGAASDFNSPTPGSVVLCQALGGLSAGTGGQASGGTGDIKFSGGNGALGSGSNGGGGGSSAGSAGNGNNASGATGGAAPTDGGAGGGGGVSAVGNPGSAPGGGGGGGGVGNGGSGGAGRVVLTYGAAFVPEIRLNAQIGFDVF